MSACRIAATCSTSSVQQLQQRGQEQQEGQWQQRRRQQQGCHGQSSVGAVPQAAAAAAADAVAPAAARAAKAIRGNRRGGRIAVASLALWPTRQRLVTWLLLLLAVAALRQCSGAPLIIAHRGSPCDHPDETLEGFRKAIDDGADYIEMDLVRTKDGHLIARHDVTLDASTDVAARPEFLDKRAWRVMPDGTNRTGWFAADFTLEEVRALSAVQPYAFRDHRLDGLYKVPTFDEVVQLALDSLAAGKPIGLYVETKEPQYHSDLGLPLEPHLVQALVDAGAAKQGLKVILQSFDLQSLRTLQGLVSESGTAAGASGGAWSVPLILLLDCGANITESDLDDLKAAGIAGIGPHKSSLAPVDPSPECGNPDTCSFNETQQCTGRLHWGVVAAEEAAAAAADTSNSSSSSPAAGDGSGGDDGSSGGGGDGSGGDGSSSGSSGGNATAAAAAAAAAMPSAGLGLSSVPHVPLLEWARVRSLVVHAYTFRNEHEFMPLDFRGDPHAELDLFGAPDKMAIDGVFVDCPATAAAWKKSLPPPKPHEIVEVEQAILEEEQHTAPPWVIAIVIGSMVLLTLGSAVYVARWLMHKRHAAQHGGGMGMGMLHHGGGGSSNGMPAYQTLELGHNHDDSLELPVSRRATLDGPAGVRGPDSPPPVILASALKES